MDLVDSLNLRSIWKRAAKVATLALTVALCGFTPTAAEAKTTVSTLWLTEKFPVAGYDKISTIEIQHPTKVFCEPGAYCSFTVQARFTNPKPLSSPSIELLTAQGVSYTSTYMSSVYTTNWQNLTFSASYKANTEVTFGIQNSTRYSSDAQRYFTSIVTGPTPAKTLHSPIGDETVEAWQSANMMLTSNMRFATAWMPSSMNTAESCIRVPLHAAAVDYLTGNFASFTDAGAVSVSLSLSVNGYQASTSFGSGANAWQTGQVTSSTIQLCGLNPRSGVTNDVSISVSGTYRDGEISKTSSGQFGFPVTGTSIYTSINCLKGKTIKVVTAAKPVCPAGYAKTNLKVVNGKLAPTTITCVKGFLVKRVTGVLPSCPSGYRRK